MKTDNPNEERKMKERRFNCLPNPCATCPYRKDTPPGIWAKNEYDKLPEWDEPFAFKGVFLCHNGGGDPRTNNTLCRGWLEVHHDNMSVRLALHRVDWNEHNSKPTKVPLYASGEEARKAGCSGIDSPSIESRIATIKILKRRKRERARKKNNRK